ncbi:MAG: DUF3990 domain-containing protein [Treponema sp.]|nr:DUF3990 domain-containing protein [Spirochaetia bacterium]MDD7460811.1 DUF3990 domain-containing protein [Spirochaetales bacterium]MDY5812854.1 DUF3990 domain-containing protein [Treponema sp.]MEE1181670.1 DUF3990 domain-containing protein [Treponema sp.]
MILYHGSTIEVSEPQILTTEKGRDFGFAFYTTDIKEQAERWAKRRAEIKSKMFGQKFCGIVNVYEWNENSTCRKKAFDGANIEWLEMVVKCRSNPDYKHDYDIVCGKIANDNVGETISYVLQGIMRKEDAIERLKFEKINNQIAFCSKNALEQLTFIKSYKVES